MTDHSNVPSEGPNRQELDPPPASQTVAPPVGVPPERPAQKRADAPDVVARVDELIREVAGHTSPPAGAGLQPTFDSRLVRDLICTALKLIPDGRDTGELKLMCTAVKELRYAYRVFGQYAEPHKVTIFGSARTPPDHPDYTETVAFSRLMAAKGWMVITGAGGGIMEAGHIGPGRERSFGVAIRLPFETSANDVIVGDSKLIHFRYFFTRKLMFLSQAEAVALFPGGFGTMDEAYEALTLIQTGKSSMIPIVLLDGAPHTYWKQWDEWVRSSLLSRGLISAEDVNLYYHAPTPEAAVEHITAFYRLYHSSRYVGDDLVIRLKAPIGQADIDRLTDEFRPLLRQGAMTLRGPLEVETDHLGLPRLVFTHTRSRFGLVRKLIDRINECTPL